MKIVKHLYPILAAIACYSCSDRIEIVEVTDYSPAIYPDYTDVVIPQNIAPLNFCVIDTIADYLVVSGGGDSLYVAAQNGNFNIDEKQWHMLIGKNAGKDIKLNVCKKESKGYVSYKPINVNISADSIDNTLVYRLIPPGYEMWNRMGIYQRNLESFEKYL